MLIKKSLMKTLILMITMMSFGLLFASIANAAEPECKHVVYCDNPKVCILCGAEDLEEEEVSETRHPYAYCYAPSQCGACRETIEEGSVPEIKHDTDLNVKYYPEGKGHRITCACGKVVDKELYKHAVFCTEEDQSVCSLCGGKAGDQDIVHTDERTFCDAEHHWLYCFDCEEMTSPLLDHYTLCTNPDGPCGFCDMEHDECIFKDEFIGMHIDVDQVSEEDGELYHISICTECKQEIIRHKGIVFEDFGDEETHIVKCETCGHQFNDAEHEYKNGVCIRCGRQETPLTGDENNIIVWIVIMALASISIFGFVRKLRKN